MVRFLAAVSASLVLCLPVCPEDGILFPRLDSPSVAQMVVREAWKQGVPVRLAFWLAMSESGLRMDAVRHERRGSISRGVFQLNSVSFPNVARLTTQENIALGVAYISKQYKACHHKPACTVQAYRSGRVR